MVMAARAAQSEAEKGAAYRVHALLPFISHGGLDDLRRQLQFLPVSRAKAQEAQCGIVLWVTVGHEIIGELHDDELIVWKVAVKSLHHPVAIKPSRCGGIEPLGRLVRVTSQVEPMPPPAFAVVRGSEQTFHDLFKGIRRIVSHEGIHFLGCRREPDQVEAHSTNQDAPARLWVREQAVFLHFLKEKTVDRVLRPNRAFVGYLDLDKGTKRPEFLFVRRYAQAACPRAKTDGDDV